MKIYALMKDDKFVNEYGLPTDDMSKALFFTTLYQAKAHKHLDYLLCDVVEFELIKTEVICGN